MARNALLLVAGLVLSGCSFPEYAFPAVDASGGDEGIGADDGTSVDSGADARPETCALNVCGGCSPATGKIGDRCGSACGTLECNEQRELRCKEAPKNLCGGCAELLLVPGAPCEACGGGVVECKGTDFASCPTANACGGCQALVGTKGEACKLPDGCDGTRICKTANELACAGPARNSCGGCSKLVGEPNTKCGSCGKWACSADKQSVTCSELAVGSACGAVVCPTSKNECGGDGMSLTCSTPNEKTGDDAIVPGYSDPMNGLCWHYKKALEFRTKRRGRIDAVKLRLERKTCGSCGGCSGTVGTVTVNLYQGGIGDTSRPLGSATVSAEAFPVLSTTATNIALSGATTVLDANTLVWLQLASTTTKYQFTIWSQTSAPGIIADVNFSNAGWSDRSFAPFMSLTTTTFGCF